VAAGEERVRGRSDGRARGVDLQIRQAALVERLPKIPPLDELLVDLRETDADVEQLGALLGQLLPAALELLVAGSRRGDGRRDAIPFGPGRGEVALEDGRLGIPAGRLVQIP